MKKKTAIVYFSISVSNVMIHSITGQYLLFWSQNLQLSTTATNRERKNNGDLNMIFPSKHTYVYVEKGISFVFTLWYKWFPLMKIFFSETNTFLHKFLSLNVNILKCTKSNGVLNRLCIYYTHIKNHRSW